MYAPTTGLHHLTVPSLQWSSLYYSAHPLPVLCWASLKKKVPPALWILLQPYVPQRESVREWECLNMSTFAALGFCLSAAGTSFTDQKDESWGGEWAVWRPENLWEQRQVTKVKVCWRCKSNLRLENSVVFLSLVCSAIKTKPRDKTKYIFKTTANINTIRLRLGFCFNCAQSSAWSAISMWEISNWCSSLQNGRISFYVRHDYNVLEFAMIPWLCDKDHLMDTSRVKTQIHTPPRVIAKQHKLHCALIIAKKLLEFS